GERMPREVPEWVVQAPLKVAGLDEKTDTSGVVCTTAFGPVYRSVNENVAIAQVRYPGLTVGDRDLSLLKELQHRNLLKALGYTSIENERLSIVYPVASVDKCLGEHLIDDDAAARLSWPIRLGISLGIATGLQHLHEKSLFFRDLTTATVILQGAHYTPKLIFAGVSAFIVPRGVAFGTTSHMCPVYRTNPQGKYGEASDVYSLGVVLGEIISGTVSADDNVLGDMFAGIADMRLQEDDGKEEKIVELLLQLSELCSKPETAERPPLADVVGKLHGLCGEMGVVLDDATPEYVPPTNGGGPPEAAPRAQSPKLPQDNTFHTTLPPRGILGHVDPEPALADGGKLPDGPRPPLPLPATFRIFKDIPEDRSLQLVESAASRLGKLYRTTREQPRRTLGKVTNQKVMAKDLVILKNLQHANIVQCIARSEPEPERDHFWIQYRLYEKDWTLADHIEDPTLARRLSWNDRIEVARGIAAGLQYLHTLSPPIAHKDLSCETVVVEGNGEESKRAMILWAGIAAMAKLPPPPVEHEAHLAPELYHLPFRSDLAQYQPQHDVFSYGVLVSELYTGKKATHVTESTTGEGVFSTDLAADNRAPKIPGTDAYYMQALTVVGNDASAADPARRPSDLKQVVDYLQWTLSMGRHPPDTCINFDPSHVKETPQPASQPSGLVPQKPADANVSRCISCLDVVYKEGMKGFICPFDAEHDDHCFTCAECLSELITAKKQRTCPRCKSTYPKAVIKQWTSEDSKEFEPHIEDEANNYFAKIYSLKMEIGDLIQKLKAYKKCPPGSKEYKVYSCMIHNMFDEFRFLEAYPQRELKVTAELFGGIVANRAIEDAKLLEALKFVITNLVANSNENLMKFSKWALAKYMHRLPDWQQYCGLLREKVKDITTLVPGIEQYLSQKPSPKPAQPQPPTPQAQGQPQQPQQPQQQPQ
ncbi:Cysteine-rich receptor-like protein kinase 40, partial [Diplonema papillatum]